MKNVAGYIVCKSDNQSLTLGASEGVFQAVKLSDTVGPTNLLFWVDDSNDGYDLLVCVGMGMVLDGNHTSTYLNIPNGGLFQQWQVKDAGDGYKQLVHMQSNNVLTGNSSGSVSLSAYDENADNQKWSVTYVGQLVQKATEKLLTRQHDNTAILAKLDDLTQQTFYFEHVGGGDYMICYKMFTPGMLALGVNSQGTLCFDTWQSLDTQKWQIENAGGEFQTFTLKSSGNKVLYGNGLQLYLHDPNGGDYQLWSPFVRMSIDRTQPYNKVTFAMAHDSHTDKNTSYYRGLTDSPEWEDQTQDVNQQLAGGIRAVRISTGLHSLANDILHPWDRKNVILQHTIALKPFDEYLERVRHFLDQNPTAILTIYDEGDSSNSPYNDEDFEGFLAEQYAATFGGQPEAPSRIFLPGVNNMPGLDDLKAGKWPTIQAMIESGVQIIVVMANGFPKVKNTAGLFVHPWMLSAGDIFSANPYDNLIKPYDNLTQDDVMKIRPACVDVNPTQALGNKLFKFNHFFYSPKGDHEESSQPLNIWTVGDLLVEDTLRAWSVNRKPPNWINVDFYQGVQGAQSHLTHLVRAINSSNTLADLEQKVKGCYIQNANGLQIGHPYTTAADTPLYQIINRKTDNDGQSYALNLEWSDTTGMFPPYVALGLVSLGKCDDATPSQQWYLKYNTPEHGIQLVMASGGFQYALHTTQLFNKFVPGYGAPNLTSQVPENLGGSDTGWEIFYDSSIDASLIRVSGDPTKVLGMRGEEIGEKVSVSIVDHNADDVSQRWTIKPVSPQPYPPFLPSGF